MATNFDFLEKIDSDLFGIISDAERLYRGEFFEQCIAQTRRFGEHVCRKVLGKNRTNEITFDEMLSTLSDKSNGDEQEKEFIDDLYFLKKCGNNSVHSEKVNQNATMALECLQRAFEVSLNYAVYHMNSDSEILKYKYDTELLITGNLSKKLLSEKYLEAKEKAQNPKKAKKNISKTKNKQISQVSAMKSVPYNKKISFYWFIVGFFLFISLCIVIFLIL